MVWLTLTLLVSGPSCARQMQRSQPHPPSACRGWQAASGNLVLFGKEHRRTLVKRGTSLNVGKCVKEPTGIFSKVDAHGVRPRLVLHGSP